MYLSLSLAGERKRDVYGTFCSGLLEFEVGGEGAIKLERGDVLSSLSRGGEGVELLPSPWT